MTNPKIRQPRNIKLTIAYDGTAYHGYQRQKNALTIQEILETKLAALCGQPITLIGAGRTDAGVHARGQVVNFSTTGSIPTARLVQAANSVLPNDIVVLQAKEVPEEFHARFSAKSKRYVYHIYPNTVADPFLRNYAWHIRNPLCLQAMNEAAQTIMGTHDFSAFRAAGSAVVDPVRTIYAADCTMQNGIICCSFWGNGFLYHMVRNLVGTLVDVGTGKTDTAEFCRILNNRDRSKAGITAPPQGLYLMEVLY